MVVESFFSLLSLASGVREKVAIRAQSPQPLIKEKFGKSWVGWFVSGWSTFEGLSVGSCHVVI